MLDIGHTGTGLSVIITFQKLLLPPSSHKSNTVNPVLNTTWSQRKPIFSGKHLQSREPKLQIPIVNGMSLKWKTFWSLAVTLAGFAVPCNEFFGPLETLTVLGCCNGAEWIGFIAVFVTDDVSRPAPKKSYHPFIPVVYSRLKFSTGLNILIGLLYAAKLYYINSIEYGFVSNRRITQEVNVIYPNETSYIMWSCNLEAGINPPLI
jgi:hypothetical protein